jgi:drug/metabolite transporter (DMT)-like permease
MSGFVMAAVLFAALLHAAWNALVKSGSDKFLDTILVACGAALVAAATLPFLPLPQVASWPYIAASALVHIGYFALVAAAYRTGDLSYVYPIMRGAAPLLTALLAGFFIAEHLGGGGWCGVLLISAGILLLAVNQWRLGRFQLAHTLLALGNAVVICIYTLIDGIGARLSGNSASYVGWMLALDGAMLGAYLLLRGRGVAVRQLRGRWRVGLGGGLCTWASYAIALWAMTRAPVALVAALRETSVIFGTVLAGAVLREQFGVARYAAVLLVGAGAVALKLA